MPRLYRIWEVVGDKKKGIPPIIPVCRSTWLAGVAAGIYPKPVKLSAKIVAWREEDINKITGEAA